MKKGLSILLILMLLLTACGSSDKGKQTEESYGPEDMTLTCTMVIDCLTILDHMDDLNQAKAEFVPESGYVLEEQEVRFADGENVFDVLKRVCKDQDIQMESNYTPLYKSYYIKGINNLYEFDCGPNSGWTYQVNGNYPNYGSSEYKLADGDRIEWRYTCNLGKDVGATSAEAE